MTNPYSANVDALLDAVGLTPAENGAEARGNALKAARVDAIRALAFEQARAADAAEAANLIAYLTAALDDRVAYPVPLEVQKSIQARIDLRLGLA